MQPNDCFRATARPWVRFGGVVVAAALLSVPISCSDGSDGDSSNTTVPPASATTVSVPPPVTPEHEPDAQARAEGVTLAAADVPEGWAQVEGMVIDDIDDEVRGCLGLDPGVGEIGRSDGNGYQYVNETGGALALTANTRVYESEAAAQTVFDAWAAETLPACIDERLKAALAVPVEGDVEKLSGLDDSTTGVAASFYADAPDAAAGANIDFSLVVARSHDVVIIVRGTGNMAELDTDLVVSAAAALAKRS